MRSPLKWLDDLMTRRDWKRRKEDLERAYALSKRGRYEESRQVLERHLREWTGDHEAERRLRHLALAPDIDRASALWHEGRTEEAERVLLDLLGRFPGESRVHLQLAVNLVEARDFPEAIVHLERAVEFDGDDPETLSVAADLAIPGDAELARDLLERAKAAAARLSPEDTLHTFLLNTEGQLLRHEGDLEAAIVLMERAFTAEPDSYGFGRLLADAYLEAGRWRDALDVVARALEFFPENEALLRRREQAEEMGAEEA